MTRAEFIKIMERSQNGDKKALGVLYEEYFGQLFVTAYQILRDTDVAYDVATNVVLALLEFKKDVTTIDNHVGYMITMVQNKAKDYIKWRKREISVSEIQKLSDREVVYDWSIAEDVDLYADWTANHYYIQITSEGKIKWLSGNDENYFSDAKVSFEYGSIFEDVDGLEEAFAVAKNFSYVPGKMFKNFKVEIGEATEVDLNYWMQIGQFESEAVIELQAAYTNEEYELNFNQYAVVPGENPFICSYGDTIEYLVPEEHIGQEFIGWYVADVSENDVFIGTSYAPGTQFDTMQLMEDLSGTRDEAVTRIYLVAKYKSKEYSVKLYDGDRVCGSFTVTYGPNYSFPVCSQRGQIFVGWLNNEGKYVTDQSGLVNNLFWEMTNTSTIILNADYEVIVYRITFCEKCLGKSLAPIEYNVFSDTINLEETVGIPKQSSKRFRGWYDSCEHTGDSITEIASGSVGDIKLHADWDTIVYVDYFDENGRYLHTDETIKNSTISLYDFKDAGYNDGYTWDGYLNQSEIAVQSDTEIYLREKYWSELYNGDHYEIWTANQLNQIRNHSGDIIHLMTDITFTGNWTAIPIFSGELYLYGHTITYQHSNVAYNTTYGFIRELASTGRIVYGTFIPKIKATASGSGYADVAIGGVVAINRGELSRITVKSKVGTNNDSYNSSTTPNVDIHVKNAYYYVGGIVGQNYGIIDTCWNYASIGGDASNIGGIVGVNMGSGETRKAYNRGDIWYEMSISRSAYIGGIVGTVADGGFMNNVSNYGRITFAMLSSTMPQTNVSYLANIAGSACETATINVYGCYGTVSITSSVSGRLSGAQKDAVKQNEEPVSNYFAKPGSGGGDEGGGCVALGTLITLADGTQVPVESLTGNEILLVWDMKSGTFGAAPILFIDSDPYGLYNVISLSFSDGTELEVITEHALWDYNLNQYVFMDENAMQYIGHWFNKQSINAEGQLLYSKVQLVDVTVSVEYSVAYSPVTYSYLCYYVNGMLSMPGATQGLINIFEVDAETMKYDEVQMQADIAQYGLFTYEEFAELFPISEEVFEAFNGQYLKVAMGKGLIDAEGLQTLIERYAEFLSAIE